MQIPLAQNNMIWTIIDSFSKQAYFIPCKNNILAKKDTLLMIEHIFVNLVGSRVKAFKTNIIKKYKFFIFLSFLCVFITYLFSHFFYINKIQIEYIKLYKVI